jgi:ferredoxin
MLAPLNGQQWFVFCTHGSIIGITISSLRSQLTQKGAKVIGFHDTYADATLPFYPHPTYTTGHPDAIDLSEADDFGRRIAERGQRIARGSRVKIPKPPELPHEWVKNAEMFTLENMEKIFPQLTINTEKCTHCLECEQSCPVNGIEIQTKPERIQDPCIFCWNCVNRCPETAIEADWSRQIRLAPKLYARYRYWLDKAASRKEFRWLVNPDDIDFTKPYISQNPHKK